MKFGLAEKKIDLVNEVFAQFPDIEKVIIYGSRAKGNFRNGSDIDLTLMGKNLNLSQLTKIELAIDELLLPYTFDISIYHHISNSELLDHIKRVGKPFYET